MPMQALPLKVEQVTHASIPGKTFKQYSRGVLTQTAMYCRIKDAPQIELEVLEKFREHLREELQAMGVPTDRTSPHWVEEAYMMFEQLSDEIITVHLVEAINELLLLPRIERFLPQIAHFVDCYSQYRLSALNQAASDDLIAAEARQAGPRSRQARALQARCVIVDYAQRFWSQNWAYRDDASNTAARLCAEINQDFASVISSPDPANA